MLGASDQVAVVGVYTAVLTFLLGLLIPMRAEVQDARRRLLAQTSTGEKDQSGYTGAVALLDFAQFGSGFTLVLCLVWFGVRLGGWRAPWSGTALDNLGIKTLTALVGAIFLTVLVPLATRAWESLQRLLHE